MARECEKISRIRIDWFGVWVYDLKSANEAESAGTEMTESDVISLVRAKVAEVGSMRELARRWGVSMSYVSDLVNGRRAPGAKILEPLGLERVKTVEYLRKGAKAKS